MEFVVADTTVLAHLTKTSPHSKFYSSLLETRRLAVSFQTLAELLSSGYGPSRLRRLNDLLAATVKLPQSEATIVWYARVAQKRKDLRRLGLDGKDASDADVWIIGSSLEHALPLMSHDKQQVALARATTYLTHQGGIGDDRSSHRLSERTRAGTTLS